MLGTIRHRGPDQFGIYLDEHVGLGNARLSIIDLSTGQQPIANEDETLWIVFNGEIFNYLELRLELESRGHRFSTTSDTEVILHLYEEYGPDCLSRLNGQFAIAIWDARDRTLFLARDRLGVRPLFYTEAGGALVFGSEIKAILAAPGRPRGARPAWRWTRSSPSGARSRRGRSSAGSGAAARPLHAGQGRPRSRVERYWELAFPEDGAAPQRPTREYAEELREPADRRHAHPAARRRPGRRLPERRARLVDHHGHHPQPDRRTRWRPSPSPSPTATSTRAASSCTMAEALGTEHHVVRATYADIGAVFPEVVWHAETPLLRTAPAPMFLLSGLVRENRFKVVLTGEGADEFLAGYDIFKEAKIRRFWAEQPESTCRPPLFNRLYPWNAGGRRSRAIVKAFFGAGAHRGRRPRLLARAPLADHGPGQALLQRGRAAGGRTADDGHLDALLPDGVRRLGPPAAGPVPGDRPSSSRSTCSRRRATGWRWPTRSKGASPSSTTAWSSSATGCRRRSSCAG